MNINRILKVTLTWAGLWLLCAALVVLLLGMFDPDSVDDGEVLGAIFILGPMGILTGFAFAFLVSIGRNPMKDLDLSAFRAPSWGLVGSLIVQSGYLGHGDAGLAANIGMALLFSAFGGVISAIWLFLTRRSLARRVHSSRR